MLLLLLTYTPTAWGVRILLMRAAIVRTIAAKDAAPQAMKCPQLAIVAYVHTCSTRSSHSLDACHNCASSRCRGRWSSSYEMPITVLFILYSCLRTYHLQYEDARRYQLTIAAEEDAAAQATKCPQLCYFYYIAAYVRNTCSMRMRVVTNSQSLPRTLLLKLLYARSSWRLSLRSKIRPTRCGIVQVQGVFQLGLDQQGTLTNCKIVQVQVCFSLG